MITYQPLWAQPAQKGMSTYALRVKFGMSHATVQRLQADQSVSTHTLDRLCRLPDCSLEEVVRYVPSVEE